jgi:recombinational DNA repair protein (RecF pathway)
MFTITPTIKICEKCKKKFPIYSFEIRDHRELCEDCLKALEENKDEKEISDSK